MHEKVVRHLIFSFSRTKDLESNDHNKKLSSRKQSTHAHRKEERKEKNV